MDIPILIIGWKRPDKLLQLISSIRSFRPTRLYFFCDGPTDDPSIQSLVLESQSAIILSVDWDCELLTYFASTNLGCKTAVSSAISWFFDNETAGVILEDDCIPHSSFFSYCSSLLDYYKHDRRIWTISGNNFQDGQWRGDGDYYFSRYNHCWGWATWRDRWTQFSLSQSHIQKTIKTDLFQALFKDYREYFYWHRTFYTLAYYDTPDTWDYYWTFCCFMNSGLTIIPNRNLVKNIGFDHTSTHTMTPNLVMSLSSPVDPMNHPSHIVPNHSADKYTFKKYLCPPLTSLSFHARYLFFRLKHRLS